jgi:hypothetical protein
MSSVIVGNAVKREGGASIRSSGGVLVYECQYSYIVQATSKSEDYLVVLNTPGLPVVGTTVEPTGYAVCTAKVGTRRAENPLLWDIVCDFSSEVEEKSGGDDGSGNNSGGGSDPADWIPIYETKFEPYQEVVTKDFAGAAVANSAGQPFANGMTITKFLPVWEFYQFESAAVTDEEIIGRTDIVNSAAFKGRAEKTLHCTVTSSVIGRYYGALRRLTQYRLRYKSDKWTHKRLDVGTVYLDAGSLKAYIKDGQVINGPLDGSGARQADGTDPAILEFDMFEAKSFSFLRT